MINRNLYNNKDTYNQPYNQNSPFPHIVFDDFFDQTLIKTAAKEAKVFCKNYLKSKPITDEHECQSKKYGIEDISKLPPILALICKYVNSPDFIIFLRKVTGLKSLIGDSYFTGGGLHCTERGGRLGVHHDFNFLGNEWNPDYYRKCNLIIFLNDKWDDSWGGGLELWDKELISKTHTIMPKLNRAVLFNIEDAPHGHPDPLNCPIEESRRSLAFYFYDKIAPKNRLYKRAYWKHGRVLR